MSKKGENIYKRKDGRWEGRYIKFYDGSGKAKYGYLYGKTYGEVKSKLQDMQVQLKNGILPENKKITLYEDVLVAWLQSVRINVKESTYMRYKQMISTHISPELGKYPINKISSQLLERFVEDKLTKGRLDGNGGLSPKTVTDIITIIKSSMEYASYTGLTVTCNLSKLSVKKKEKEMRVLSTDEQKKLTSVLLCEMDLYKMGVLISLYTGIRIGELCALKWENLNLNCKTLRVRETMQRIQCPEVTETAKTKIVITEPKSKCSIRDIPLPDFLVEIIKQFQSVPKAYVLTGDRNKYVEPRTMQNRFQRYVEQSDIDSANYHSLRHTFATRCVEVGFEIKSLSEILGHANVNITLNRYVHSSFELKSNNMNKLSIVA